MSDTDVIERFRASKTEHDNREGVDAGTDWAQQSAEAHELEALDGAVQSFVGSSWTLFDRPALGSPGDTAWIFFRSIKSDEVIEPAECREFWERILGDARTPSSAFVEGFADGALQVWRSVRHHL